MTRALKESSDQLLIGSDCSEGRIFNRPAHPPSPASWRGAVARPRFAGLVGRKVQALRTAGLPLRQWARPWAEALSVDQHDRTAAADGLCAQRGLRRSRRVPRQFPQGPQPAERDLCDQRRASAPPRSVRLNGPGRRHHRLRQGGRHSRQHDRILSRCRRPAVRTGGG